MDISRFYVSSYLENKNAKIQGSKMIITGKINFEIPNSFVGSIDQKIPTTFQLKVNSKK